MEIAEMQSISLRNSVQCHFSLWISLFCVFLIRIPIQTGAVEYGPSLEYLVQGFASKSTGSAKVEPKEIFLESYFPSHAVVIPLANGSSSAPVYNVHPDGEFVVFAPEGHGVMVVIQHLRLRTSVIYSEEEDATFLKCRDYLKFQAGNQTSFKTCGSVLKYSRESNPRQLLGHRSFLTDERQLNIRIHTDKTLADHDYGWHETIAVELVITAYQKCPKTSFMTQWAKWTGNTRIKSCSPNEDVICIYTENFCDGVMNCGVAQFSGHIGFDETNCKSPKSGPSDPPVKPQPPVSTDVPQIHIGVNTPYSPPTKKTLSPLYLILIFSGVVLVMFGACTWLAKVNDKKFQHTVYRFSTMRRNRRSSSAANNSSNNRTEQRTPENNETTLSRVPNAPPDGDSQAADPGTEGPPPYDDLFPSASAPPLSHTPSPTPASSN